MLIRNTTKEAIEQALTQTGITFNRLDAANAKGTAFRVTLKASKGMPFRRLTRPTYIHDYNQYELAAVCWHGHLQFLRALYGLTPTAKVITSQITYTSLDDLEEKKQTSYDRNAGSMMEPVRYGELCRCGDGHEVQFSHAGVEGGKVRLAKTTMVPQSRMSAECMMVQAWGLTYCDTCEFKGKRDCGGKKIRKTGKNEYGFAVPIGSPVKEV